MVQNEQNQGLGSRQDENYARYASSDKGKAARAAASRRYQATEKGKEARRRAAKAQALRRAEERRREAERRRVVKIIEAGILDRMGDQERHQWLRRCADVNPVMSEVLMEMGIE